VDPFQTIRRAARDRRSGAAEIAATAARGLAELDGSRDVMRAARILLRAHPAMAPLWRLLAVVLEDGTDAAGAFADRLSSEADAAAHAARWAIGRRAVVLTHSSSSSVRACLHAARTHVAGVICTESLPGGEGKALARRLAREGFDASWIPDAAMAGAADRADVALIGADAVTEAGAVNKIGSYLLALAAREAGTPCYVVAGTSKFVGDEVWRRVSAPLYEQTPLALLDGVIGERGVLSAAAARRIARRIKIPAALLKVVA
jgi:translation initiation factor eIF-2B subunit delta